MPSRKVKSYAKAKKAVIALSQQLDPRPSWLVAIGTSDDEEGTPCVLVYVTKITPEVLSKIGDKVNGVAVLIKKMGGIRPAGKK